MKVKKTVSISGRNFACPDSACSKLAVQFGLNKEKIVVPAKLVSSSKIEVDVPAFTKPDVLPISISFNGHDFTKSDLSYGYFDPFVIRVAPEITPAEKSNKLTVHGFGFINPDNKDDIKIKFTSPKGELTCNGNTPCIVPGIFVDKNTITTNSKLMSDLIHSDGS